MQLNRPFDSRSLLLGAVATAGLLALMAQATPTLAPLYRVQYGPHPRDMVQIKEGTPYVVPVGKILVLTGVGTADMGTAYSVEIWLNGTKALGAVPGPGGNQLTVLPVPSGLTAGAGTQVEVESLSPGGVVFFGVVWGYLSEQ